MSILEPLEASDIDVTREEDIGLHRQQGVLVPCEGGRLNGYKEDGVEVTKGVSSIYTKGDSRSSKIDEENHKGGTAAEQVCTEYGNLECYVKSNGAFPELPKRTMVSTNAKGNLRRRADQSAWKITPGNYELVEQVNNKALAIIADELLEKEQL